MSKQPEICRHCNKQISDKGHMVDTYTHTAEVLPSKDTELIQILARLTYGFLEYGETYGLNIDPYSEDPRIGRITLEEAEKQVKALIERYAAEAYKKGYADGGVEEILRHEQARKSVEKDLKEGNL